MIEYHKIQTVYKRDPETKFKACLEGEFALPEFDYLRNNIWVWTEKVDGTNVRVLYESGVLEFKGKTDKAELHPKLVDRLHAIFDSCKGRMGEMFQDGPVCLYGEGYGEEIQSGGKYIKGQDFVLFDIKIGMYWLRRNDVVGIAEQLNLRVVPIIGSGTLEQMVDWCRNGFKSTWGDFIAEGIVAKPETELFARSGHRIITKIKYKDFVG